MTETVNEDRVEFESPPGRWWAKPPCPPLDMEFDRVRMLLRSCTAEQLETLAELAVEEISRLRSSPRLRAMALQLYNCLQGADRRSFLSSLFDDNDATLTW